MTAFCYDSHCLKLINCSKFTSLERLLYRKKENGLQVDLMQDQVGRIRGTVSELPERHILTGAVWNTDKTLLHSANVGTEFARQCERELLAFVSNKLKTKINLNN